jgi:hypothetical protein
MPALIVFAVLAAVGWGIYLDADNLACRADNTGQAYYAQKVCTHVPWHFPKFD